MLSSKNNIPKDAFPFLEDWSVIKGQLESPNYRAKILGLMSDRFLSDMSYKAHRAGDLTVQSHFDKALKGRRFQGKKGDVDIDVLKSSVDMLIVVESYVGATRWKKGSLIKCPFPNHADGTPSLSLHPEKGYYVCFGCGKKGSVIDFVMNMEGCSLNDAVVKLKSYL